MTSSQDTVDADTSIIDVAELFISKNRKRFPVLASGKLIGQISRSDVLKALQSQSTQPVEKRRSSGH